jgi:uncharacterized membrane-anchored protein
MPASIPGIQAPSVVLDRSTAVRNCLAHGSCWITPRARPGESAKMTVVASDLIAHPLRDHVLRELHARPFATLPIPCRISHFAFLTTAEQCAADRMALANLRERHGITPLGANARHARMQFGPVTLRWEQHGEFTTYSWESPDPVAPAEWPDHYPPPGPLIAAAALTVARGMDLVKDFPGPEAAISQLGEGEARIATDFAADADGFVRIAIDPGALTGDVAGPLAQRLLEIDTYRTLALLGLPEAQGVAPLIQRIEAALPPLIEQIRSSSALVDGRGLLDRLSTLAAELEEASAASAFRFGATRAYAELVNLRLEAIGEIAGARSWAGFLSRRLGPAMRTCRTTEARQANLSLKLSRAVQLLRTQVEVDLAHQNRDLLEAMNERVRLQIQVQQAVEGLSVVAITYYAASLVHLILEGVNRSWLPLDPLADTALAVPAVAVVVTWLIRRLRSRHALSSERPFGPDPSEHLPSPRTVQSKLQHALRRRQ